MPTILIVEDDPHARKLTEKILRLDPKLQELEITIKSEPEGESGFAEFMHARPSLMIIDLVMPKLSGFDLIAKVRERSTDVKIIATSAIVKDPKTLNELEINFNATVVPKPIHPQELVRIVKNLLTGKPARARQTQPPGSKKRKTLPPQSPTHATGPWQARGGQPPGHATGPWPAQGASGSWPTPGQPGTPAHSTGPHPARARGESGSWAAARSHVGASSPPGVGSARRQRAELKDTTVARLLLDHFEAKTSGALDLRLDKARKVIFIDGGSPVFAQSNLQSEKMGELLVRRQGISREQHDEVQRLCARTGLKYGEALIQSELLTADEVRAEVVAQTRFKLATSLVWGQGNYTFAIDPNVGKKVPGAKIDPVPLIFEGLRTYATPKLRKNRSPSKKARLLPLPRLARYRAQYVEIYGDELIQIVEGEALVKALVKSKIEDIDVQIDALLQTSMAKAVVD